MEQQPLNNQADKKSVAADIVEETEKTPAIADQVEIQGKDKEIETLKQQLAESQAKTSEYLDGWQRSLAEFSNYKKRIERDQAHVYQTAIGNVVKKYLEILDDLDRALKSRPLTEEGAVWANGIELIYRKLITILENEGVKLMDTKGKLFDPKLHEAISLEENKDFESGQIIEVLKQGYLLGDRVLRPALVRVAK